MLNPVKHPEYKYDPRNLHPSKEKPMSMTIFTRLGMPLLAFLLLAACAAVPEKPTNEPAAPTDTPLPAAPDLPDLGPAPEITNEIWVNSEQPLTLASQRGKVVLLEFWTFG